MRTMMITFEIPDGTVLDDRQITNAVIDLVTAYGSGYFSISVVPDDNDNEEEIRLPLDLQRAVDEYTSRVLSAREFSRRPPIIATSDDDVLDAYFNAPNSPEE